MIVGIFGAFLTYPSQYLLFAMVLGASELDPRGLWLEVPSPPYCSRLFPTLEALEALEAPSAWRQGLVAGLRVVRRF